MEHNPGEPWSAPTSAPAAPQNYPGWDVAFQCGCAGRRITCTGHLTLGARLQEIKLLVAHAYTRYLGGQCRCRPQIRSGGLRPASSEGLAFFTFPNITSATEFQLTSCTAPSWTLKGTPESGAEGPARGQTTFLCNMQLFKGLQGMLGFPAPGLGPFVDTRPSQANGQQVQDSIPTKVDQEAWPAHSEPCAWVLEVSFPVTHGQLEGLCHANTSVLAPGGHELFLGGLS